MFSRISAHKSAVFFVAWCSACVIGALKDATGNTLQTPRMPLVLLVGAVALAGAAWFTCLRPSRVLGATLTAFTILSVAFYVWPAYRPFLVAQAGLMTEALVRLVTVSYSDAGPQVSLRLQAIAFFLMCVVFSLAAQRRRLLPPAIFVTTLWFGYLWMSYVDSAVFWAMWFLIGASALGALWLRAATPGQVRNNAGTAGISSALLAQAMAAVSVIIALALPQSPPPLDFSEASRRIQQAFPVLSRLRGGSGRSRYTLERSGFGSSVKELGGPANPRHEVVASVKVAAATASGSKPTPDDLYAPLYLRTEVWVSYTGRGWTGAGESLSRVEVRGGYADLKAAALSRGVPGTDARGRLVLVTVRPEEPGEQVLLLGQPLEIRGLFRMLDTDKWGTPWFASPEPGAYEVWCREPFAPEQTEQKSWPSPGSRAGDRVPDPGSTGGGGGASSGGGGSSGGDSGGGSGTAIRGATPEAGLEPYLSLPANLPPRVRSFARDATAEATDDWDAAKRLEQVVRTFAYTLTPQPTPADTDFVDHFLFNGKQGYCTYHSTALAILCRSVGIPARWVTGYLSSQTAGEIHAEHAHAWVEVYIRGSGWLVLEGTPAFEMPRRISPGPSLQGEASSQVPSDSHGPAKDERDFEGDQRTDLPHSRPLATKPGLYLVVALTFVLLRSIWATRAYRLKFATARTVTELYDASLWALAKAGFGRKSSETPSEYLSRLVAEWPEAATLLRGLTEEFESEFYSVGGGGRPAGDRLPGRASLGLEIRRTTLRKLGWPLFWSRLLI